MRESRSRAGASRDDQVSGFKGRFYVDDSLFLLFVILTKVLVRISIHAAKNANTCKCNVAS
jgi:hypothetical protein